MHVTAIDSFATPHNMHAPFEKKIKTFCLGWGPAAYLEAERNTNHDGGGGAKHEVRSCLSL